MTRRDNPFGERAVRVIQSDPDADRGIRGLQEAGRPTLIQPIVAPGNQQVPAGATYDLEYDGTAIRCVRLQVDIPAFVDATLSINGTPILQVADGKGLNGEFPLGDFSKNSYLLISRLRIEGRNNASEALDVRAFMVGVV